MATEKQQICDEILDSILTEEGKNLSSEHMKHLENCEQCQEALESIGMLQVAGSPFKSKYYKIEKQELKNKILTQTAPILNSLAKANKTSYPHNKRSFSFFKTLLAFAVLSCLIIYVIKTQPSPTNNQLIKPQEFATIENNHSIDSNEYRVTENGTTKSISIDNPISLFAKEQVKIELPDGSKGQLTGPARMSIQPRGFHLIQGDLFIEVAKNETKPFIGTTPHCEIKVLGTAFNCATTNKGTKVAVKSGKVAVTQNDGTKNILNPGDSAQINKPKTLSDSIAPKDSE